MLSSPVYDMHTVFLFPVFYLRISSLWLPNLSHVRERRTPPVHETAVEVVSGQCGVWYNESLKGFNFRAALINTFTLTVDQIAAYNVKGDARIMSPQSIIIKVCSSTRLKRFNAPNSRQTTLAHSFWVWWSICIWQHELVKTQMELKVESQSPNDC